MTVRPRSSDVGDLAAGSVLDPWLACRAVLGGERDEVALAQPVVACAERDLALAEFAALGAQVLRASVEPVNLVVRGVCDQRDLADVAGLCQLAQRWTAASPACSRVSVR